MKLFLQLLLLFIGNVTFCQNMEWGKFSQKEIEMTDVSFESGAEAVKLGEIGHLKITESGYELLEYDRTKILSVDGFDHAQKKWSYHPGVLNDKVVIQDAHTVNFVNGTAIITPLDKKDIIISRNGDEEEIAFAFPNVRIGSIIEYKVKILRTSNLYASPWRFQNSIPTISSQLFLNLATTADYKTILKGKQLNRKYGGKKNNKRWELLNIPSDNVIKNVYNPDDYRERLMYQYTSARLYYGSYYSENTWNGFRKLINNDIQKSKKGADFKEIANSIRNGSTKLETLRNTVRYLRDHYQWNRHTAVQSFNLASEFLKKKTGNTADFNIVLEEILKVKNIQSEIAVNSLRSNGRIIVAYPTFSKLQTLVNIVEIDNGEKLMIDAATSQPDNLRFLSLNHYNYIVLGLEERGDVFTVVSPPLSEFISQQNLTIEDENSQVQVTNRSTGYFNSGDFKPQIFNVFRGIQTNENTKKESDEWQVNNQTISFENPANSFFVIENPLSKTLATILVEKDRDYPIEIDFPFLTTVILNTKLPENYHLESTDFNRKISAFNGALQYLQQVELKDGEPLLTWSLLINKTVFETGEIQEYQNFTSQLSAVFSEVAVAKKVK